MNKDLIYIGIAFLVASVGISIILFSGGFDLSLLNPDFRMLSTIVLFVLGGIGLIFIILGSLIGESSTIGIPLIIKERNTTKPYDDAMNILNTRYVKGEITEEEYEKMKKKLEG